MKSAAWLRDPLFLAGLMLSWPVWALALWCHVSVMPALGGLGAAFSVVVTQPLFEELFFRGVMQQALTPHLSGLHVGRLSGANVLVSVLFAAAHLWRHPPLLAGAVLIPGLLYGHLRDRWSSIWPGVFLHAYHNMGLLVVDLLD